MHDEMMTLFDDCIERMLQLRAQLAATRRVHPGERQATVLDAIEVAEYFASEATRAVCPAGTPAEPDAPPPGALPAVPGPPQVLAATVEAPSVAGARSTLSPAR